MVLKLIILFFVLNDSQNIRIICSTLAFIVFGSILLKGIHGAEPTYNKNTVQKQADPNDFPYVAALHYGTIHLCGVSIIHKRHVLTTASCCYWLGILIPPCHTYITVGPRHNNSETDVTAMVKYMFVHEAYNEETDENNIAVLRTCKPFLLDQTPLLRTIGLHALPVFPGIHCKMVGWHHPDGQSTPKTIFLYTELELVETSHCRKKFKSVFKYDISEDTICAEEKEQSTCEGIKGNVIIYNKTILGMITTTFDCKINILQKVGPHIDWIDQQVHRASGISFSPKVFRIIFLTVLLVIL